MNLICWNYKGVGMKRFKGLMSDLIKEHDVGLLCLLETHSSGDKETKFVQGFLIGQLLLR